MRQHTFIRAGVLLALAAAATLLPACESVRRAKHDVPVSNAASIQGPLGVDVANARGSVSVVVVPGSGQPTVTARRVGGLGFERKDSIKPEWVAAEVVQDGPASVLRVLSPALTDSEDGVAITVYVPSCSGLRVRNAGGPVTAEGVAGAIDIQNGSVTGAGGSITVTTRRALTAPISLVTVNGPITLEAGEGSTGDIRITAPSRRIAIDAEKARLQNIRANSGEWTAVLNGGANPILIDSGGSQVYLNLK